MTTVLLAELTWIALGAAVVSMLGAVSTYAMYKRSKRLLRETLQERLGMDEAFLERVRREFLKNETKEEKQCQ